MRAAVPALRLVAPKGPPPPVPPRVRLTRAIERAMRKAKKHGAIGRAPKGWREPFLDKPLVVDRAVARGWLAPTWAYNRYALTVAGRARLRALDKIRRQRK